MQYTVLSFLFDSSEEYVSDLLAAELGELGFESFEAFENGLNAYIQSDKLKTEAVDELIANFIYTPNIEYKLEVLEDKNWNEEWEKNYFEPIIIDDQCVIHSSFHKNIPSLNYNIIIDPKMAFGTGHHETTGLMISEILKNDFNDKTVLDMGCGTSILAILAIKRGATSVTAIDIDDWCVRNSQENIALNHSENIEVLQGDSALLIDKSFDIIIANINRNILLDDMAQYAKALNKDGELYISGFYSEDATILTEEAEKHGLIKVIDNTKNNWMMIRFKRK